MGDHTLAGTHTSSRFDDIKENIIFMVRQVKPWANADTQ